MKRQIILDTETTGLEVKQGHRLIEVGCLEMINRRLTGRTFHYYLNPEREVDPGAFAIHGLSNQFLADKPLFATIANEFIEFVNQAELIIHNATFDINFLNTELRRTHHPQFNLADVCKITDTLALARQKHPGQPNNLDALCRRYQVNNSNRQLHGALLDAELLAYVYLQMTGGQDELFILTDNEQNLQPSKNLANNENQVNEVKLRRVSLPIIYPTQKEQQDHQNFLAKIREHSGQCLWLDLEEFQ